MAVRVTSAITPYRSDPIISFTIRYQLGSTSTKRPVTRGELLCTLMMGNGTTSVPRLCSSVRVNKITLTTSANAALQWVSQYAPSAETTVTGTSTTAPGVLTQRPPNNSTASFWSIQNNNESETLFYLSGTLNDYVDVHFSVVLMDDLAPAFVTLTNTSVSGQLYRSYLDGPAAAAVWIPVNITTIF